jgi:murein DD-endopeptidase MepM/ murein hydrolase activator NlpD
MDPNAEGAQPTLLDIVGEAVDSVDASDESAAANAESAEHEGQASAAPAADDEAVADETVAEEVAPGAGQPEATEAPTPKPAAAKPEGEDDLSVPDDLKGRTRERFEKLTTTLKETRQQAQQATEYAQRWRDTIESTKAPPEAVGETLEILRLIHSGDPAQMGQALDKLEAARANLAKALGRDLPGVDPLGDHADLAAEVERGELSRQRALELARIRAAKQAQRNQSQQQTAAQQREQAIEQGAQAVDQLLAELKRTDASYATRMGVLQPMLRTIAANTPPERWVAAVREAYAAVRVPASAPAHQPLRPAAAGAGGKPAAQPASVLDAINAALG